MPLKLEIVTQERRVYSADDVEMVVAPGTEGEMGILPHHAPLITALQEGVKLTIQQLLRLLHQHGLEPEEALGKPFNPHRHDAVCTRKDQAFPDQIVVEVWQKGWRRGDECFRHAKVVVNDLKLAK